MTAENDDYPGRAEEDAELEAKLPRLHLALNIKRGRHTTNKALAMVAVREAEAQQETAILARFHAEERDHSALVAWAATPEAQETAARAKTIGLFDPVSPEGPRLGPQCPPKRLADPDRSDRTNPAPEAGSGALSAGDARSSAPRPGRWRRWCRWISE